MTSRDPIARAREEAEVLAYRAARDAHGLFVRGDELAVLGYYIERCKADRPGADFSLVNYVSALLERHRVSPIETRPVAITRADHQAGRSDASAFRCSRCRSDSVDLGGGYRECRRCGRGFCWLPQKTSSDGMTALRDGAL